MINGKTVLAIIPARGGSKGLPGKNIKDLCGKPLIGWTIEKAKKSRYLDEVLVTTDCDKIAEISALFGASVPFIRPKELATDSSPTIDAIRHTLNFYKIQRGMCFDYVVLLEPTSPLREDNDIDNMLEKLDRNRESFDSIISIGKISEHPVIVKKVENDLLIPFFEELKPTSRRQDNKPAYFPYGVAYIVKTTSLLTEKTFYTRRSTYYFIQRYQNYEIDDIYDFVAIEAIMRYQWRVK